MKGFRHSKETKTRRTRRERERGRKKKKTQVAMHGVERERALWLSGHSSKQPLFFFFFMALCFPDRPTLCVRRSVWLVPLAGALSGKTLGQGRGKEPAKRNLFRRDTTTTTTTASAQQRERRKKKNLLPPPFVSHMSGRSFNGGHESETATRGTLLFMPIYRDISRAIKNSFFSPNCWRVFLRLLYGLYVPIWSHFKG